MRLILENSTVCLISRRISLLCPVGIAFGGVAVSLTMILADALTLVGVSFASFVQSGDVALIDSRLACCCPLLGGGGWVDGFRWRV